MCHDPIDDSCECCGDEDMLECGYADDICDECGFCVFCCEC